MKLWEILRDVREGKLPLDTRIRVPLWTPLYAEGVIGMELTAQRIRATDWEIVHPMPSDTEMLDWWLKQVNPNPTQQVSWCFRDRAAIAAEIRRGK